MWWGWPCSRLPSLWAVDMTELTFWKPEPFPCTGQIFRAMNALFRFIHHQILSSTLKSSHLQSITAMVVDHRQPVPCPMFQHPPGFCCSLPASFLCSMQENITFLSAFLFTLSPVPVAVEFTLFRKIRRGIVKGLGCVWGEQVKERSISMTDFSLLKNKLAESN